MNSQKKRKYDTTWRYEKLYQLTPVVANEDDSSGLNEWN